MERSCLVLALIVLLLFIAGCTTAENNNQHTSEEYSLPPGTSAITTLTYETYQQESVLSEDPEERLSIQIENSHISGTIDRDQTWSGTILVTGDVEVREGVTLTILPGTVIQVTAQSDDQHGGKNRPHVPEFPKDPDRIEQESVEIRILGTLNATGLPGKEILFTSDSAKPTTYDWSGLSIHHGILEYAIVEYARYNNVYTDVIIANSTIRNSLECCLGIGHMYPVSPQIVNNTIYSCGHECIDISGGSPIIRGNTFLRGDSGIQPDPTRGGNGVGVLRNAYPIIEQNKFESLSRGVLFLNGALQEEEQGKKAIIRANLFIRNNIGVMIEQTQPRNVIVLENNSFKDNKQNIVG